MNTIYEQTKLAYRVAAGQAKKAGKPVVKGGWLINRDDLWDLLDEMAENPDVKHLKLRLLKGMAERDGLSSVLQHFKLCGWPIFGITEGPTTVGLSV